MDNLADKIKALRIKLGLTTGQLASRIGVDQSTVSKYELGKQRPKGEPNQKLAELAGISIGEWLGIEPVSAMDVRTKMVPVVGELCAGDWREAIEWEHDDRYEVPALLDAGLPGYPLQGYIVRGSSMNRYYPDGAVVFAAATISNGLNPVNGDHVIAVRRDRRGMFEASLKEYVVESDGSKWLWPRSSDQEHAAPLKFDGAEEVTITGIVQASFITRPRR